MVALMFQFCSVWIMAIATTNPLVVHLALDERAKFVHFVLNLPVGVINARRQIFVHIKVVVVAAGGEAILHNPAAGMARRARLDLSDLVFGPLHLGQGIAALAIPKRGFGLGELHRYRMMLAMFALLYAQSSDWAVPR